MVLKLNLIAAACENMGIGKNNNLPWRLKTEMDYFSRMTSQTEDANKKNVVIMGRRTWDSIPAKFKPLPNRINFVLSRSDIDLGQYKDTFLFNSFQSAIERLESGDFKNQFEAVWVIGGSSVYKEALNSKYFHRLYLTKILKQFDCDTFLPPLSDDLVEVSDPRVPTETQEEKGIPFIYKVYEHQNSKQG